MEPRRGLAGLRPAVYCGGTLVHGIGQPSAELPLPPLGQAVELASCTYTGDSDDLFCFPIRGRRHKTSHFTVRESANCIRSGNDVRMLGNREAQPPGSESLLRIVERDGAFLVDRASPVASTEEMWLVVWDLPANSCVLSEGDVIKLGRFELRVRKLVTSASADAQPDLGLDESGAICCPDGDVSPSTTCRICLQEGSTEDDPLFAPCLCKGSIECVHLGCLRKWIRGRLNIPENPGLHLHRPLFCELCKGEYPTHISFKNETSRLVEVPKIQPPYIVFEDTMRNSQQGVYVISVADRQMKLGRATNSDVRLVDESVSDWHATVCFDKGCFILSDLHSRFGTCIALRKPWKLEVQSPISIQVGRTVLSMSLQLSATSTLTGVADPWSQTLDSAIDDARNEYAVTQTPQSSRQLWVVIGGVISGGIIVRSEQSAHSPQTTTRLATGALVEEMGLVGERLHYRRILGAGPDFGWVSLRLKGSALLTKVVTRQERGAEAPLAQVL